MAAVSGKDESSPRSSSYQSIILKAVAVGVLRLYG